VSSKIHLFNRLSLGSSRYKGFQHSSLCGCLSCQANANKTNAREVILNVNIPHGSREDIYGIVVTPQGLQISRCVRRKGRPSYTEILLDWRRAPTDIAEPGTHFWALANNDASITPLMLSLTDTQFLPTLKTWELTVDQHVVVHRADSFHCNNEKTSETSSRGGLFMKILLNLLLGYASTTST